jgi:multiple sugar transport system ATP-binding protein
MSDWLTLHRVTKRHAAVTALDALDLAVREGELLALVGPSGCGKTTTLHVIAGLLDADAGDVRCGGRSWRGVEPAARNVALVFQDGALYPHLTVAQNLAFALRARGRVDDEAIRRMAERLEITALLARYPRELSGGEKQRVALGRALVRRPSVLLLDEPLANLDAPLRERMRGLVQELVREIGVTTIFVTHDQAEALAIGDRVAVMRDGRIVQIGSPPEIYHVPRHEFVARFFGSPPMNLLPGERDGATVRGPWGALPCPAGEPRQVWCGFRPEAAAFGPTANALTGVLVRVEFLGAARIAVVRMGEHDVRVRVDGDRIMPALGAALNLAVPPDAVHLFDAATGERL